MPAPRTCDHCGRAFDPGPKRLGPLQRYCTVHCRQQAGYARVKARRDGTAPAPDVRPPNLDPTTGNPDYTADEVEFAAAVDRYKREKRRPYPTWREVLWVAQSLGYRKVVSPDARPAPDLPADAP